MKRDAFLRQIRKEAKKRALDYVEHRDKGKGSHYRIIVGGRITTVQSGDLTPRQMDRILKQIGFK